MAPASNRAKPLSPDVLERIAAAPELNRARARSVASLAATGAGAVAAGVTFGSAASHIPPWAHWAAVAAVIALLAGVCFYVAASLYERDADPSSADQYETTVREINSTIRRRTGYGSVAAIVAVVCLAATVVITAFQPRNTTVVKISLTARGLASVQEVCPDIAPPIEVTVSDGALTDSSQFISVTIPAGACGDGDSSTSLFVPRRSVSSAVAVSS